MSPARSWHSARHAAGSHDWLPKKTGGLGLRRGRIRWIPFAQSLLTVAHQPRAGCIRLVHIYFLFDPFLFLMWNAVPCVLSGFAHRLVSIVTLIV